MMKILIAPDKFKGSLNAREVAENIAKGLRGNLPDAEIEIGPMADGGEGTAEAICEARSGARTKSSLVLAAARQMMAGGEWRGRSGLNSNTSTSKSKGKTGNA